MFPALKYIGHALAYGGLGLATGRKRPFIAGLVLNNQCNLHCAHCHLESATAHNLGWEELEVGLDRLYGMGIRSLAITGGEPFLWRDGIHHLRHAVELAYQKGFLVTSVYTNGTLPIEIQADNVFVSLDGMAETTRRLRGPIFDTVLQNIARSKHPKIFVNFTINRINTPEIEEFCLFCRTQKHIRGIFFYFHTPYYGMDDLFIPRQETGPIVQRIMKLKHRHPILNSSGALRDYLEDRWPRPSDVCVVYTNTGKLVRCCRAAGNAEACANCGYLGYLEVINITRYRPSAILGGLAYLPSQRARRSCVD